MGMTKTQTDAANEQTAANWMYADCFADVYKRQVSDKPADDAESKAAG